MKVLLADDEPLALERLERLLTSRDNIVVCGRAKNGQHALELARELRPDVVLLDIHMPVKNGLECARALAEIPDRPAVIFTTAFDQHAIEAFDSQAIAYLLKPVNREKLDRALDRAESLNIAQLNALREAAEQPKQRQHVRSRSGDQTKLMPIADVRYFQAEDKYVVAHGKNEDLLLDESLKQLEKEFPELLLRVHRNALVNRTHVVGTKANQVKLADIDHGPEISRRHHAALRKLIKSL